MSEVFSSIGTALSGAFTGPNALGNILKTAITGVTGIGDILGQRSQNASLNRALAYQKNPGAAAAEVASLTQPISQGLTQSVGNDVQGYLAERGLAQSPNITAYTLAQALAPYQQQNSQQAQALFQSLLNPAGAKFPGTANWGALMNLWKPTPSAPTSPGGTPPFFPANLPSTQSDQNTTYTDSTADIDPMAGYSGATA